MSGQQHAPVPETTPLPPAPQPDGHAYQPGPDAGPAARPSAGPTAGPDAGPDAETDRMPVAGQGSGTSPGWGGGWGGPPSAGKAGGSAAGGKPWTMKRGLVVAGAATVLAAGAGATVYGLGSNAAAANGTAAGTRGGSAQGGVQGGLPQDGGSMGGPGGMQAPGSGTVPGQGGDFAPDGLGGMGSGISTAVHSEYVVEENGQYVTKVAQLGTVSAVSSGSVTVRSADGFTRTYTLSGDTAVSNMLQRRRQSATGELTSADIVSGATVRIVAGKDGSAFAAESVQVSGTATTQSGGSSGSGARTGSSQSS
ncbi:hypothetical protein [Arthrobacter sp. NPDC056727]|uniref:hypothetical protein n=1 Tax=Arthrobacter sp. NPDC056727 TaxID=3345927 RepID=UPI00366E907E